jgi:hypothetical protein
MKGTQMTGNKELSKLLAPTSTTSERTRGLLVLLHPTILADAVGVKVTSLRNWSSGQSQPRSDAAIALDDLRATAQVLIDADVDANRAAAWLTSRDPSTWEGMRPVEKIRIDPMDVLAAAHGVVLDLELETAAKSTSRVRRERALALVSSSK